MVSFDVGSEEKAEEVLSKVKYFTLAESLGAIESLISIPSKMTHASIPSDRRKELGITDGLIRISVGLEDVEDIIWDLDQALTFATGVDRAGEKVGESAADKRAAAAEERATQLAAEQAAFEADAMAYETAKKEGK